MITKGTCSPLGQPQADPAELFEVHRNVIIDVQDFCLRVDALKLVLCQKACQGELEKKKKN